MKITKKDYEMIEHLKSVGDSLAMAHENAYQRMITILGVDDGNGWVVDYFFNNSQDLDETLEKLGIEVEKC